MVAWASSMAQEGWPKEVNGHMIKPAADLSNLDLKNADLSGADLSRANLRQTNLSGANLTNANLNDSFCESANLTDANLSGASLHNANLSKAKLSGANLSNADLTDSELANANLTDANLKGTTLVQAHMPDVDLTGVKLQESNWSGALLRSAKLKKAIWVGADLSGANLEGSDLSQMDLSGFNFKKCDLRRADLSGANLTNANLNGCHFESANLTDANLDGASLHNAFLHKAKLLGANLSNADLTDSNLSSSNIAGANLKGVLLEKANLANAMYDSSTLFPDSFEKPKTMVLVSSDKETNTVWYKGSLNKEFSVQLNKGLNMISLPLEPETPMTAKSLLTEIGATVLIKLDKQTKEFVSYVPEVFDSFNFTLEGAEGYIVNVMKDQEITFNGIAWDNTVAAPSNLDQPSSVTWAFTVVIDNPQLTRQPGIVCNLRTGQTISTSTLSSADLSSIQRQAVSLVDQSRQPVVEAGDLIEVTVGNSRWRYQLNQSELERAYVHLDLAQMTSLPTQTQLLQNYPNPFNPETWIPFDLAEDTEVAVTIYDVEGQTIRTLDLGWVMAGRHHNRSQSIYWDGRTEMGETVASGVYFYQISAADYSQTRRMVILK